MKAEALSKEMFAQALEWRSPTESEKYVAEARRSQPGFYRQIEFLLYAGEARRQDNTMPPLTLIVS